uniref:Reverse transcriptase domain-containing protein n=1 Tax=Tanacetum cinerariifolium TaxID=118510 RepID=A0A6L2NCL1_TANCI|nr:reverse transcriptase domain-containing protein [Tanacetum cinerariifolium]
MRTRSSSNLVDGSSPNPSSLNPKRRNRRRTKQPFILEESPVDTMADQRTMAELLRAPTEGYAKEIMVPPILAEHFELKHSLINMMNSDQFFGLEKDNPHDHILHQQTSAVTTAMTAIFKQFQATPPPASVKAVEEICVTCGVLIHIISVSPPMPTLSKNFGIIFKDTFQQPRLTTIRKMNEINIKAMQTQINNVKNELRNEMKTLIQASMSNQTNELKNMMASFLQMNTASTLGSRPLPSNTITNLKGELKAITTQSGLVLDGPSIPMPPPFINPEEDERVEETLTDLELAGIARDVFVLVGKFTFNTNFVIVDYESDPRVPLILGRPFLRTARALIDVHGEEMILQAMNPLSGSTTSSSPNHLLEEFADELALITFPSKNDDLPFDIESDLREIEYFLNYDPTKEMDSIIEDSSKNDDVYNDPFDSKEDKIKESKLLIDELDPPKLSDFLPSLEYNSFLFEDFFEVDALPSTNNKDKVFNPGIFIHENLSKVTVQVAPDKNVKKISISNASLILEEFNPPLYELPFHKEVLGSKTLLSFSSENEEKVFKTGILTSKGVHTSLLPELSHRGPKAFKVIKILKARWSFSLLLWRGHLYFGCSVSPFLSPMNNSIRGLGQAK